MGHGNLLTKLAAFDTVKLDVDICEGVDICRARAKCCAVFSRMVPSEVDVLLKLLFCNQINQSKPQNYDQNPGGFYDGEWAGERTTDGSAIRAVSVVPSIRDVALRGGGHHSRYCALLLNRARRSVTWHAKETVHSWNKTSVPRVYFSVHFSAFVLPSTAVFKNRFWTWNFVSCKFHFFKMGVILFRGPFSILFKHSL